MPSCFWSEVGETPYRVDGLLAHLQLAGILDELAGIVLGGFTDGEVEHGKSSLTMQEVFEDYFGDLGIPVATGLRYGHFPDKVAVPVGVGRGLRPVIVAKRSCLSLKPRRAEAPSWTLL